MLQSLTKALIASLIVPAFGLIVYFQFFKYFRNEQLTVLELFGVGSFLCGLAAILLIILYFFLSSFVGSNRSRVSFIFPKLAFFSIFALTILIAAQGVILTYGIGYTLGQRNGPEGIVFLLGAGALLAVLGLIFSLAKLLNADDHPEMGVLVEESEFPRLWSFVKEIANELNASPPNNVVVGLSPTFYATAADVLIPNYATAADVLLPKEDRKLSGQTLFLSLPLMRLFTTDELRSVVGHELGHFRGGDTEFSLKFAPIYRGLQSSLNSLGKSEKLSKVASALPISIAWIVWLIQISRIITSLPAKYILSLMIEIFSRNQGRISQKREFEADKAGASVSSPEVLGSALGKVAIYSDLWLKVKLENIIRLSEGKISANLSEVFQDSSAYDVNHMAISVIKKDILETITSHPTDTHPPLAERFKNIGFDADRLTVKLLSRIGRSSEEVLEDMSQVEIDLTVMEHKILIASGLVKFPSTDEIKKDDPILIIIYSLAASMVGIDGKIEQSEIQTAENLGTGLIGNFDPVDFRFYCKNLVDLPKFKKQVDVVQDALSNEVKELIYEYLKSISRADGDVADEEKEMLLYCRSSWGIEI